MAAERGCSARRDGAHDASLDTPEMTGMRLSERFAMAAKDIPSGQKMGTGRKNL